MRGKASLVEFLEMTALFTYLFIGPLVNAQLIKKKKTELSARYL